MTISGLTRMEMDFIEQVDPFLKSCLQMFGLAAVSEIEPILHRCPVNIPPVVLNNPSEITCEQRSQLLNAYHSEMGVAYFVIPNAGSAGRSKHPLFEITSQLEDDLSLKFPLVHPQEGHPEAVKRFGPADGTVKIYDLPGKGDGNGYREQAETAELFAMHHDGLGSGGTVQTVVLYCDQPPLWGGLTCFTNVLRLCLELARDDFQAFQALFLPDALTIIRPRGKGAIKVVTPALFLNAQNRPQSFVRVASGEYSVEWREDFEECRRARAFMEKQLRPLATASSFINMSARGHGCLIRNETVAHSRSAFVDHAESFHSRLLSRKWFMSGPRHGVYKHVPGMFISESWAKLMPDRFGDDVLWGEWRYDRDSDRNIRLA